MAKVKQLVGFVLSEMTKLHKDSSDVHIYIRTESQNSFQKLTETLESLKECEDEISALNLGVLTSFLHARWKLVKHSPASPFSYLDSRVNKACLILAKEISCSLDMPINQILMPGVDVKSPQKLFDNPDEFFKLHVLLTDHQIIYLPMVMLSFQKYRRWELDHQIVSEENIYRIINHSSYTQEFFKQLDESKGVLYKLDQVVASLKLASKNYNCMGYSKDYLHTQFLSGVTNVDLLTNKMCSHIPRAEWDGLLHSIDKGFLVTLLKESKFASCKNGLPNTLRAFNEDLSNKIALLPDRLDRLEISNQRKELKVAAFCAVLLRAAYVIRQENPWEYYSSAGPVLALMPSMTGVYSKTAKLEAISAMLSFFVGDNRLISYENYHNTNMQAHAGALAFGETATIKNKLKDLARYFMPAMDGPVASLGM